MTLDTFGARRQVQIDNATYTYYHLPTLTSQCDLTRLPYSLKILLENLLRTEDGQSVTREDVLALCRWDGTRPSDHPINFTPSRVILQDFTGVPAVVDLAAMRAAMQRLGGDATRINPLGAVDLVIDHSVMVDYFGDDEALQQNIDLEFHRNRERYQFLRWGQKAFSNFRVVPPGTGIVHQVNLEYLAAVVATLPVEGEQMLLPDTLVGTDSHTTMINGLGVLGWGVGGIEAEAAMLGQSISMLIPEVVGVELTGTLPPAATATDLVLTVTEMLRKRGVVGKFVEFYGAGLSHLPLADRATIANMAPEYGATCGIFPIDNETLRYLALTGRTDHQLAVIETYAKTQGLWRDDATPAPLYSDRMNLDLGTVVPSIAGPKRPQDRISLNNAHIAFSNHLEQVLGEREQTIASDAALSNFASEGGQAAAVAAKGETGEGIVVKWNESEFLLKHGAVVLAAITSCTNTSNPAVLIAAGLLARNAVKRGLQVKPWVKTSFAPGSQVVPAYLAKAGLMDALEWLGFNIVGFGCTTCIGNSGPLPEPISDAIRDGQLVVSGVLSGNRNFEGRIHQEVPANYLASPPLVVAYALAGTMDIQLDRDPIGVDEQGNEVFLRDLWPTQQEVSDTIANTVSAQLYRERYADVFSGTEQWRELPVPEDAIYSWPESTYVKHPPYFMTMSRDVEPVEEIKGARCLVKVGDSITTDHISPAGAIRVDSPAGQYLTEHGVKAHDFNSYGSRRGNHEVMVRGTFANVRLRNQLAPGTQGGWTRHLPTGEVTSIYEASQRYQASGVPLIVLAGREYGTGSSRDWAAKGTNLLGIRAVLAQSYERIHRSNLVGFGVLPLQFLPGESAESLQLTGDEQFDIGAVDQQPQQITIHARRDDGTALEFQVAVRIDTASEWDYYRHGGILQFVLRDMLKKAG